MNALEQQSAFDEAGLACQILFRSHSDIKEVGLDCEDGVEFFCVKREVGHRMVTEEERAEFHQYLWMKLLAFWPTTKLSDIRVEEHTEFDYPEVQ